MRCDPPSTTRPTYPTRFVNLDEARARYGERVDRLGDCLRRSDPLADAVVLDFEGRPRAHSWDLLERALSDGIDAVPEAPDALTRLFEQIDHAPLWLEDLILERGGKALLRTGVLGALVLALKSIVYGYAAPAGNKPLIFSGALVERAARRLNETSKFVRAVCLPGGMRRDGEGFAITVKVRLMHARVRQLILTSGRWDASRWGHPINQHDMLATAQLFSTSVLHGLEQLGFEVCDEERELYMLLWRYVSQLMGVEPDLLISSYAAGMRLSELIVTTQAPPDDDSRALVDALFSAGLRDAPNELIRRSIRRRLPFIKGLCRGLIGDEIADGLAIPDTHWKHAPLAIRAMVQLAERLRMRVPGATQLAVRAGTYQWQRTLELGLAGAPATFQAPRGLARSHP